MRLLLYFVLSLLSQLAYADDIRPASLNIIAKDDNSLEITWKMPIRNNQRQNLEVILDKESIVIKPKQIHTSNNAYTEHWEVSRKQGINGLTVFIEGLKGTQGDVLLRLVNKDQETTTVILNTERDRYQVADKIVELSTFDTVLTYLALGIEHILIGLDHLLFVACLVYISRTKRKLLWTITGFTIAHSITLILSALNVVNVPIAPVESVIALSIVFLAWEIAKNNRDSISYKYPVLVSSSFGLLHGFGFASVLSDIGLPQNERITALLSFNIGVEIGQLLFVAALFLIYWFFSKLIKIITLDGMRFPVSYLCGIIAAYWMIERIAGFTISPTV